MKNSCAETNICIRRRNLKQLKKRRMKSLMNSVINSVIISHQT